MKLEPTLAGLEARLTPHGAGRWGGVAFLSVWLCFWTVGEVLVGWLLLVGGWSLLTGAPPGPGREPLALGPSLFAGVFMLAWLLFWTFGGLMAWHEWFRLVWSGDRLLARSDGLEVVNRIGPFTRRRWLPRDTLRGFFRIEAHHLVQAETAGGVIELTRNGTPAEQTRLIAALTAELRLPDPALLPPLLPDDWREVRSPEGDAVLVKNPAPRRTAARVMWLIALPLTWAALTLLREAWLNPNLGAAAAILAAVAGFALWGAVRLTWARDEWRLEQNRLIRQKRFGQRRRETFAGAALRLTETTDSDGDPWFKLELRDSGDRVQSLHEIAHDPTIPRQLGRWLAARTGLPFEDRCTAGERARAKAEQDALLAEQRRLFREWIGDWVRSLPGLGGKRER
ncbi:MAG: hypothetical protein KIT44_06840 [Opitutaceae bacterium]|nr:hypothetical protein [Opitutaceae bacterium]